MNSLILAASARPILLGAIVVSVWILLRGHDEPGGGFIGGLIAAAGLIVLALAEGAAAARRAMRVAPPVIVGLGLLAALASGAPAMLGGAPLLTHAWATLAIGPLALPLGTTLVFDLGVYLVVVGMATAVIFPFLGD